MELLTIFKIELTILKTKHYEKSTRTPKTAIQSNDSRRNFEFRKSIFVDVFYPLPPLWISNCDYPLSFCFTFNMAEI